MTYRLCIVYQMDPRGLKVGGIETHVRMLIEQAPADFDVCLVGVDAIGDLPLGRETIVEVAGRRLPFLPVIHYPDDMAKDAASKLKNSLSLRFTLGLARHLPAIRRLVGRGPVSFELQRYEASWLPVLLRRPFVSVVHNQYKRDNKTDSLIGKFWALHRANETFSLKAAERVVCVNPAIRDTLIEHTPSAAAKSLVMSVSVDTSLFQPTPFDTADGILKIAYAGRFEEQKDPALMFSTIAALSDRLGGKVEFHYIGTSDPERYSEFAAIAGNTVRHGFQTARGVRDILARCHFGLLTSHFEGMPCFMLETLASGRAMAAITLPQFEPLIVPGRTGVRVPRQATTAASAASLADAVVGLWRDIQAGHIDPAKIAPVVEPYSAKAQLPRLFEMHRAMQEARNDTSGRGAIVPPRTEPVR